MGVRVPQIGDQRYAIELYYSHTELSTGDIRDLFKSASGERISGARALKLKAMAREKQVEDGVVIYDPQRVNTEIAYKVWGIDIAKLERAYKKLCDIRGAAT